MKKKAWSNILNLFFIFIALAIVFGIGIYSLSGIRDNQSSNSTFYNSSDFGVNNFIMFGNILTPLAYILGIGLTLFGINYLIKSAKGDLND